MKRISVHESGREIHVRSSSTCGVHERGVCAASLAGRTASARIWHDSRSPPSLANLTSGMCTIRTAYACENVK
jgi:hypothetical protein